MEYISAIADGIHLYRCAVHGEWQLGPGDIHRPPLEGLTTLKTDYDRLYQSVKEQAALAEPRGSLPRLRLQRNPISRQQVHLKSSPKNLTAIM